MAFLPGVKPQLADLGESLFTLLFIAALYPLHEHVFHPHFLAYLSERDDVFVGTALICGACWLLWFWAVSAAYALVDLFEPAWAQAYKVQPRVHVTGAEFRRCLVRSMWNLLSVGGAMTFGYFAWVMPALGWDPRAPFPSVGEVLAHLVAFTLAEEVAFYYSHRMVHENKWLYKTVHKIHHEFKAPFGPAAVYCHWFEMVVSNVGPIFLGPLLLRSHVATISIWLFVALHSTITGHSGYFFPGLPSPLFHDYHHEAFNTNYGMLGLLDALHGTSDKFVQHLKAQASI